MAEVRTRRGSTQPYEIQNADLHRQYTENAESENGLDESLKAMDDSGCTISASDGEEVNVEASVAEDMRKFEESFKGISSRYRLINRIGEGTFSTVYKAEDLEYDQYDNDWDIYGKDNQPIYSPAGRRRRPAQERRRAHFVAIKKIYVTSSPARIMNELDLLHDLRDSPSICPLITAFRHQDQVIAILPYFRHLDFRSYFKDLTVADMRSYFRSLFAALYSVHAHNILHRDIKPTNFLYDPITKRGVLVDFGLAERQGSDAQPCLCQLDPRERRRRAENSYVATHEQVFGFPNKDQRPSLRANRAGTRGFRAPEVLFKCTAQTTKIDVWSAGVILLTIASRRFPFFNSADDIDAVIELTTVFGKAKMKTCALMHGQVFETNIPTISEHGFSLEKIMLWSTNRPTRDKNGNKLHLKPEESEVIKFMTMCLELDPDKRLSARDALKHPFLTVKDDDGSEDEMDVLTMSPTTHD